MKTNFRRLSVAAFVLTLAVLILTALPTAPQVEATSSAAPEAWRIAPPAPKISEAERLAELAKRRQEALKRMGDKSIMVLFSTEPRIYTFDVDYHYRQENNLYYLTGINQDGAALVLIPGAKKTREILFVPKRDPRRETWTGRMLSNDDARGRSGIQEVWDMSLLNGFLATLAPKAEAAIAKRGTASKPNTELLAQWKTEFQTFIEAASSDQAEIYLLTPQGRDLREYRHEHEFAENLKAANSGLKIRSAHPIFAELRLVKSDWELKLLQHAADITSEAFHRVFAVASPTMFEYEIQAEFEYTFKRRGADNWGYPCIVGAGANATTLHYITNQEPLDNGSLLLMDCASEFDHYTADITRTIPINGKFTKEQADIYRIVYDAQTASINRVRAGNVVGAVFDPASNTKSVQGVTAEIIKDGLFKLGLITSKDNNEFRTWFMHGTSHWIGMNVHDVGDYRTPLAPGMVLTVEPGIYIRPDALDWLPKTPENERFIKAVRPAFEKYKGIGIRIEDDILVTTGDPVNMSASIPRKLEEVEATMARLKQELRKSGWPQAAMR
ncbi:MAG: aminopeptidase P N-terminal domain-containing protein [Acidobacteriota bacterium]|nr:aminopeptidase P N-terminal domain-containing protein [Acidobacteriota bacterium]